VSHPVTSDSSTLRTIRRGVLFVVTLGTVGIATELTLIGHTEDSKQLIPLALAAAGVLGIAWAALRPGVVSLRALQLVMLAYMAAGVVGIVLHFQANAEFQREVDPAIGGRELFWKVVEATAPPALSPGLLIQLGLLGLVYTYRHPGLREEEFGS
jgi:hypothetical protein